MCPTTILLLVNIHFMDYVEHLTRMDKCASALMIDVFLAVGNVRQIDSVVPNVYIFPSSCFPHLRLSLANAALPRGQFKRSRRADCWENAPFLTPRPRPISSERRQQHLLTWPYLSQMLEGTGYFNNSATCISFIFCSNTILSYRPTLSPSIPSIVRIRPSPEVWVMVC